MPQVGRRQRHRESDAQAQAALDLREGVDQLEANVQQAILTAVQGADLDPDVLEAMNNLVSLRRELWVTMGDYFAALRAELSNVVPGEREVAMSDPLPDPSDARFAH